MKVTLEQGLGKGEEMRPVSTRGRSIPERDQRQVQSPRGGIVPAFKDGCSGVRESREGEEGR